MQEISDNFFDAWTHDFKLLVLPLPIWLLMLFKGQKQMKGKNGGSNQDKSFINTSRKGKN
jgi:hypothetical protein